MELKTCTQCGTEKPRTLDFFYACKKVQDGLQAKCKMCKKSWVESNKNHVESWRKKYYKENKDKAVENTRKWRIENAEKYSKYNEDNKEQQSKRNKKYREDNKERIADHQKVYKEKNKENISAQSKIYRNNNKDRLKRYREDNKEIRSKYYKENREKFFERSKKWREENKDKLISNRKKWFEANEDKAREQVKKHYESNKDEYIKRAIIYRTKRLKNDPVFRLISNLRNRTRRAILSKNKIGPTLEFLGCTTKHFRNHIEAKFRDGMTWENYGSVWHLDHIKPFAAFDNLLDKEQQREVCHYTNLQPLLADENRSKGAKWTG